MKKLTKSTYKELLDCHLANLYSFYFKLFKYEQYAKKSMNLDISSIVDDTIDVVNQAIENGEKVYTHVGPMPELSMNFLTERSMISHQIDGFIEAPVQLLLEQDRTLIEQTLSLTIYCTDAMSLKEDRVSLSQTQHDIGLVFNKLQVVLQ